MSSALAHRGPDDDGSYADPRGRLALAARRLSILDVEGGHQPLASEDGSVWAVLNGEIYNHGQLRDRLARRGHRIATRTDTELLVHLYEEHGDGMVHALEGMFAFAVWDERRGRLVVARDRFGEKPLFYRRDAGGLAFASELGALRRGIGGLDELDPAAVDSFFVLGYVPGPGSIVAGVEQLPPGHLLVWEHAPRTVDLRRYWDPLPPRPSGAAGGALADLVAETEELLDASVSSRTLADVPLGVFLSGGVDSTLVAALAARRTTGRLSTFTVGYELGGVDERRPARIAAREIGSDHHEVVLTGEDVSRRLPPLLAAIDQPIADKSLVAAHAVAALAREHVTVAVGGEGADEIFSGYPRYRWLGRAEALHRTVPAPLLGAAAAAVERLPLPGRGARLRTLFARQDPALRHVDWVTGGRRHTRPQLYGPRLRGTIPGDPFLTALGPALEGRDGMDPSRLMALDQGSWLPDDVLAKADRAGMLVSLEVRTPYLHRQLVELAGAVPASVHGRHGGKFLLRQVLRRVLPAAPPRRKTAFRVPAADWLRGPLAPVLAAQLREGCLYREGWFDRAEASRAVGEHLSGLRDRTEVLWPLLCLGSWLDAVRSGPRG